MIKKNSMLWFFILAVFVLPVSAFAILNWFAERDEKLPVYTADERPTFDLVNQHGDRRDVSSWSGKIVVANFFFTTCPTICPAMTKNIRRVREDFAIEEKIIFSSFSVDPERDSVARLIEFGKRYGCNEGGWDLLTGEKKEIYRLARKGFNLLATDGDGGEGDFIHSEKLILLDKKMRIRGYYDGTSEREVKKLVRDIKLLKNEK